MRRLGGNTLTIGLLICFTAFGQEEILNEFLSKNGNTSIFVREGKGIRLKTPPLTVMALLQPPNSLHNMITPFAVSGNFEYSANYHVTALSVKGKAIPAEGNAELSLWVPGYVGYIGINVGVRPNEKECFNILRIAQNSRGMHYNIITLPRKSDQGRIGMRRVGNEVIFTVSDGLKASPVEVVRYPLDTTIEAYPRLSAYQGNGPVPVNVNVLFDELILKADKIVRTGIRSPSPSKSPETYPMIIDYSKNVAGFFQDFTQQNGQPNDSRVFKVEENKLRVLPFVSPMHQQDNAYHMLQSRFGIAGDFEISFHIDVTKLGPIGPHGYGATSVGFNVETDSAIGSVNFGRGHERSGVSRYSLTRYSPTSKGGNWDTQTFPTSAKSGTVILRRASSEIVLLAQDDGKTVPTELARIPFISGPIKQLRIYADQGGTTSNPIDVAISNIQIKAASVDDPKRIAGKNPEANVAKKDTTGETLVLESAPIAATPEKKGRSKLIYFGLGFAILLGAGLVVLRVRSAKQKTT
jgi:hypothetical protein